jgi:hypothetical protein
MGNQKPQPTFEQYLRQKAERNLRRSKSAEEARAMVGVAMTRRFRGDSASDRFGFFSPDPNSRQWLGDHRDDTEALSNMHFLAVVKPAVKANLSAMVTAAVKCTSEPALKDPQASGVAAVAQGVYQFLDGHEDHWNDGLEARIASVVQLSHGAFIRSRHNPHKRGEQTAELTHEDDTLEVEGEYACAACASGGPFFGEVERDEASGFALTACPECGQMAEVVSEPSETSVPVPSGVRMRDTGDSETSVHTSYEIRVDERRTQGGNLRAARWFEHHYLVEEEELRAENPSADLGSPEEPSFTLKWLRALESGTNEYVALGSKAWEAEEVFEVREICLLPEDYAHYRVPAGGGYVLRDESGEELFRIDDGERLKEKFPRGFRFRLAGQVILPGTAEDPGIAEYDFRDEWTYCGFSPDGFSFWMPPPSELLAIQDDVNVLFTIDTEHRQRAAKTTVIGDRMAFDLEDLENDIGLTKEGFSLEPNDSLDRHVTAIPNPAMTKAAEGLLFLFQIMPQVGVPPPAASGAPDPTEDTYAGQRLKRESALGLLSPSQQSKAKAKVAWFKQHLKIAQKTWPPERFEYLRSRFGEEWKEQDVQAFLDADLDRVLEISYAEGSEIPTTLVERQQQMGAFLAQVIEALPSLAEAGEYAGDIRQLISRYAELNGIDVDIADTEGDERLAKKRLDVLKARLRAELEAGTPPEMVVEVVLSELQLQVLSEEGHATHIEFWGDRSRALLADEEPDLVLVACCEAMVKRHKEGQVAKAQEGTQMELAATAPARELAAQEQAAAAEAERARMADEQRSAGEAEAAKREEERAAQEAAAERERADKEEQRAHEVGLKAMELRAAQEQRPQPAAR